MPSIMSGGSPGSGPSQARFGSGGAFSAGQQLVDVPQAAIAFGVTSISRVAGKFRRAIHDVTEDGTGAPLGNCTVHCFRTSNDVLVDLQPSDASGNYEVSVYDDGPFYCVAYKAGSPDVAGTTSNQLTGV
jgi:hypothetical protein